jgi:hypothetical protein
VQEHLASLSASTIHPYHPAHSATQHKTTAHGHSFESLHFWCMTGLVLDAALWVYGVNYPMLFHPVDVVRRFGCTGPVGIFINEAESLAIRHALGDDYEQFRAWAAQQPSVIAHLDYYGRRPPLTDEEIKATCVGKNDPGEFHGVEKAYAESVAKARAYKAALSLTISLMSHPHADVQIGDVSTLAAWREFAERKGR